ncbi:hypothetical protein [Brachybacterium saurashtrense]|uniref:Integral membrane protein n=1 Tax=Brachybacterium saurashtrense TaxID=556288 RepID=A0A345YMK9_9MICO|nr:hypothetical protein [Brachybacterium saurashtrense]AXK45161.1 hypothetical protein DWV08_05695 [Brachybacterium saurashtrense]RRR22085.1 hypothetical protein DXU92_12380 [Brachybacterium saurashtrense]
MTALSIVVAVLAGLTAALGGYYALRELNADLVLLGGAALLALSWVVLGVALGLRDLAGATPPDRITLYGYLLTALMLAVGGGWAGLFERSRWGSLVVGLTALVTIVLLMRLHQIWPGGFA